MIFGNLEGLVNGTEQVVWDREVSAAEGAQSSLSTPAGLLNGDEDGWYTIITRAIGPSSAGTDGDIYLQINGDTGTNYGLRGIVATNTTVGDTNVTSSAVAIRLCSVGNSGTSGFNVARLYAKSGAVRLLNSVGENYINGTTIDNIKTSGHVWNNSADNIVSMVFKNSYTGASSLNVGTRVIILKSNNFTGGTPTGVITTPYIKGAWVRVGSQVLGAPASSVTFSGLDGDRDVLYYLSYQFKASGTPLLYLRPNNDGTQANFGYQRLYGSNTSFGAERFGNHASTIGYNLTPNTPTNGYYGQGSVMMFAKSGFVRPIINSTIHDISGTTVTTMNMLGQSWTNTASNITSLVVATTTANMDTGSQFDLYALRPNG